MKKQNIFLSYIYDEYILYTAVIYGFEEIVFYLIKKGVKLDINNEFYYGYSLFLSLIYNHFSLFKKLIELYNEIPIYYFLFNSEEMEFYYKKTLLHLICKTNKEELYYILDNEFLNINFLNKKGRNCLFNATKTNNFELCNLLIKKGSYLNINDYRGLSVIHLSSSNSFNELTKLFVENGANINLKNHNILFFFHLME